MKALSKSLMLGAAMLAVVALSLPGAALAGKAMPSSTVTWKGNGIYSVGAGTYDLKNAPICDEENTPYLLFVLSSTKSINSPTIKFGSDSPIPMVKTPSKSGTTSYKYRYTPGSPIDLAALLALPVKAIYTGIGTPTFTVSHGCLGGGGDSLTVHFIGELGFTAEGNTWIDLVESLEVCEAGSSTGCADFTAGTTPGATKTLPLSGPNMTLDVTVGGDTCEGWLLPGDTAAGAFYATVFPLEGPHKTWTTSTTFSGGDDAWFVVGCGG